MKFLGEVLGAGRQRIALATKSGAVREGREELARVEL